ncbi:hypothetical protein H0A71_21400 [Alcaligenaceae bacterium]|nr:hypothetical protein [Alcaligenaceae bacterium]
MTPEQYIDEFRTVLANVDTRASVAAHIRAVLPIIEARLASGSPYRAIVEDLNACGVTVNLNTFKVAMRRARAVLAQTGLHEGDGTPAPTTRKRPATEHPTTPSTQNQTSERPVRINTPEDLAKIRDQTIDLDALREEGLSLRRAAKRSAHESD